MNTLHEHITEYLEFCQYRKRLNKKTLKAYRIDLAQYETYCIVLEDSYSLETVDNYVTSLHIKYEAKTAKRKIACLKTFFHYLDYKELLVSNPFTKLALSFREERHLPKTIPLHTIIKFFNALYNQRNFAKTEFQLKCCLRDIAVIELLFATGMRISELCSLSPNDIDFDSSNVLIYGKGAKERLLDIGNPDVLESLILYKNTFQDLIDESGYFFVNRLHNQLSDQSVRYMINRYCDIAGIDQHITPHMFRHSFASLLLEQDVDIRYIQHILGHSSINTTMIYTHVADSKQKEILYHKNPRNYLNVNKG